MRESNQKSVSVKTISRQKLWLFRLSALILVPTIVFSILELGLRIAGFGYPTGAVIKCKLKGKDVFTDNVKFGWRFHPRGIAREFAPFTFNAEKSANTYRIFVLGSSAAMGVPEKTFNFGRMLQVMLSQQYPGVNFEVINTGITAMNSHVIRKIAEDCAAHQGDLFIAYMGNNEVIGPFGTGTAYTPFTSSLPLVRAVIAINGLKVSQLLTSMLEPLHSQRITDRTWQGMSNFLKKQIPDEDPRLKIVYHNFQRNLEDITETALKNKSRIILCTLGSNLKDCPPFASMHRKDLPENENKKWNDFYQQGVLFETEGKYIEAIKLYQAASEIDDRFADLQFRMGKCYMETGEYDKAKEKFNKAQQLDVLRFRAHPQINEIIRKTAENKQDKGIYFIDAAKAFEENSPNEIPGQELFYEHVHMNFKGNYLLAKTLFAQLEDILPEWVQNKKVSEIPLLSQAECEQSLAYTEWDHCRIEEIVLKQYIKQPPFTNQLYHQQTVASANGTPRASAPEKAIISV